MARFSQVRHSLLWKCIIMIFITIGTQAPFDRLIKAMDELASEFKAEDFKAQVFKTSYAVRNMEVYEFLSPTDFDDIFDNSKLIISHAGMGTIISALTKQIPIVIIPRKASLGEHRNEHQLATAEKFKDLGYVHVANDENELKRIVKNLLGDNSLKPLHVVNDSASSQLTESIKDFIKSF